MWTIFGYVAIGLIFGFLLGWIIFQTRFTSRQKELEIENVQLKKDLDYEEFGGAPLLGIDGVVIICHGG